MFNEVLSHERDAVDLSRAPLPLLEGHDRSRTNIGIVTGLRVAGGRLRGELVLGASQRALELAEDIGAGIVSGISIGYTIDAQERDEKAKRITATRWTPYEVSLTPVPADTSVGINRSAAAMPEPIATPRATEPEPITTEPTPEAAERQRAADIVQLVGRAHLPATFARTLVADGVPLERARGLVIDELARRDEQIHTDSHVRADDGHFEALHGRGPITAGDDLGADFRAAAVDSVLLRSGIPVPKPHAATRDVSASAYDLARICLGRSGKIASRWLGGEARGPELLKRAMTTSDFPLILSGALHAAVRNGYETEPASHRAWVRVVPVPDFRDQLRPILGSAPALEQVLEHGEYREGSLTEDSTSYRVGKVGILVSLTWETLVNDNLGAFLRIQPALGQAARRKEADTVYALLAENSGGGPLMQDGSNLFVSGHGNLATGAAFDAALLGAGRTLLRKQTAVGGGFLSLVPRFLIVPAERETAAEILLANATRKMTTEKTTAEWIASLQLVVEPRLASSAAFLAADTAQIDTVELGVLDDNASGPVLEEEQEFKVDLKRWKVRHVFGAKALDWRGLVRLPITP